MSEKSLILSKDCIKSCINLTLTVDSGIQDAITIEKTKEEKTLQIKRILISDKILHQVSTKK